MSHTQDELSGEMPCCALCLEHFSALSLHQVVSPSSCCHHYHLECLHTWTHAGSNNCPLCMSSYDQMYFVISGENVASHGCRNESACLVELSSRHESKKEREDAVEVNTSVKNDRNAGPADRDAFESEVPVTDLANGVCKAVPFDGLSSLIHRLRSGNMFGETMNHTFDTQKVACFLEKLLELAQSKFEYLFDDGQERTDLFRKTTSESCSSVPQDLSSILREELSQDRALFCRALTSLLDAGLLFVLRVLLTPEDSHDEHYNDTINGGALELLRLVLDFATQGIVLTRDHLQRSGGLLKLLLWFVRKLPRMQTSRHSHDDDDKVALNFLRCCCRFGVPLSQVSIPAGITSNVLQSRPSFDYQAAQRTTVGSKRVERLVGGAPRPERHRAKRKRCSSVRNEESSKTRVSKKSKENSTVKTRSEKKTPRVPPPPPPQRMIQPVVQRSPGKRRIKPVATTNISHEHLGLRCYHGAL